LGNFMKLAKTKSYPYIFEKQERKVPSPETLMLMPRELVEEFQAFIFNKKGRKVEIAALNPENSSLQHFVNERFGKSVKWYSTKKEDVSFILKHYARDFKEDISRLMSVGVGTNGNIVELVNLIIGYAIAEEASDVHVEPSRNESIIRFRVDGILHQVLSLPKDIHTAVVARFKIMANLKIDDYRHPQDGRIELERYTNISLRISTMPTLYGEKIALRILDDSHKDLSIQHLGFSEEHEKTIMKNVEKPFGMIVASGPTGCGKTTTLYGLLHLLKKDKINISTLEDPIEYAMDGVNQIQINPRANLTFASGLRSLLRQDPDVMMVGEIRDSETAIMASEAALTGHLVLTTLHTNDAVSVITRFLEMKVEEFAVASTLNVIIAQRLVRKVCDVCGKEKPIDDVIFKKIRERKDIVDALRTMGKDLKDLAQQKFLFGEGCDACMHTGYRGRVGIFEVLEVNKSIYDLIIEHAPSERIKNEAAKFGFYEMMVDGLEKVFKGITTFEEVLRATRNT